MIRSINEFIGKQVEIRITFGFGNFIHFGTVERYEVKGTDPIIAIEDQYRGKIFLVDECEVSDCGKYLLLDVIAETSLQRMQRLVALFEATPIGRREGEHLRNVKREARARDTARNQESNEVL